MNSPEAEHKEDFENACSEGSLYQIALSDSDVMTSVDPCTYSKHGGLNETFVLTTIDGKTIAGLHYETIDLEFIASRERNAKRKRLMLTPDFSSWKTKVVVKSNQKDQVKPHYYEGLKNYNAMGGERQDVKKKPDGTPLAAGAAPPVEPSFFSKYWMYIMGAMFILPRLLGEDSAPAERPGAPAAAAPAATK
jgi:hypothetical protein